MNVASVNVIVAVAVGGAVGAVARYLMMTWVSKLFGLGFPFGTLAVNVLGSFLIGVLVEAMTLRFSAPMEVRALLAVGLLGGFTTFSTFSLDVVGLVNNGHHQHAAAYILGSVLLSIGGLVLGLRLVRLVFGGA